MRAHGTGQPALTHEPSGVTVVRTLTLEPSLVQAYSASTPNCLPAAATRVRTTSSSPPPAAGREEMPTSRPCIRLSPASSHCVATGRGSGLPHSAPRSLSVGARHSRSRSPSMAVSPSRRSEPVARSKTAGPRRRRSPSTCTAEVVAGIGTTCTLADSWPHATSWPASAQAASSLRTALTVSTAGASPARASSPAGNRTSADPCGATGATSTEPPSTVTPSASTE
ncbi:hypothetical protein D9M72_447720 [compost metagenome]